MKFKINLLEKNGRVKNYKPGIFFNTNKQLNYYKAVVELFTTGHLPGAGTLTPLLSPRTKSWP